MRFAISSLLVIFFILTVETASHHRRHKASNAKDDDNPVDGDDNNGNEEDGGNITWRTPEYVKNFEVPDVYKENVGIVVQTAPKKSHSNLRQRSHTH